MKKITFFKTSNSSRRTVMKRMLVVALIVLITVAVGGLAHAGYYCGCVGIGGSEDHYVSGGCGNGGVGGETGGHALVRKEQIGDYIKDPVELKKLFAGMRATDKQTGWTCF